ncbi:CBS domain-containing protein [Streptomyces niveiscabiei]|uniref:CBS domain-containing protein n=1 Tax=Streptomyces niveiscabiei TaxID=164115 RepID=UPI0029B1934E|nr:CBS domain-containing protein [Streptomyces niveiscabiei]MDX3386430.1 CBS domain-containing protein [Streptomyces niveiscabiei]
MDTGPYTVRDVMTRTVVAVGRETLFKDVVTLMERWQVDAVPVLEGDGRVIGVVSEADLLPKEEFRDRVPDRAVQRERLTDLAKAGALTAGESMSAPAVTVHADTTVPEAARIMARRRVKRLYVIDAEGYLEGVVSRADLLKVFLREDRELAAEVRRSIAEVAGDRIGVEAVDGVVTLTGSAADSTSLDAAGRLARTVEGVVEVRCRLEPAAS